MTSRSEDGFDITFDAPLISQYRHDMTTVSANWRHQQGQGHICVQMMADYFQMIVSPIHRKNTFIKTGRMCQK